MLINPKDLAKIQYHGEAGITRSCLDAITRLIQFDCQIVTDQVKKKELDKKRITAK